VRNNDSHGSDVSPPETDLHEACSYPAEGMFSSEINPYQMALRQFDTAVRHLDLKRGVIDFLREPKRALIVTFPGQNG